MRFRSHVSVGRASVTHQIELVNFCQGSSKSVEYSMNCISEVVLQATCGVFLQKVQTCSIRILYDEILV
jgi:hypothetical protein